jgi:alkyl hydroperoxide reductase subunit AhpC
MALRINSEAPNFTAETTQGKINFHEWIGDGWAILFSHPKDFTPVCTTELGYMASLKGEFDRRNTKVLGLSVDPAGDHATVRSVFLIGPDKKIKAMLTYPMSTGRNFDEVLRLLDSCQLTAKHKVATPVNWKQGEDVIIVPAVSDAEAKEKYPQGWKSPKPYLRIVPQPK